MLEQVCNHLHNYFEREVKEGTFIIANGSLTLTNLLEGQRFKIKGSALNDGIYTYHQNGIKNDDDKKAVTLNDEKFTGSITAMGVPRAFLDLVDEISTWTEANASAINSPFTSESFGGYTYVKSSGVHGAGQIGGAFSWQDMFRSKLHAYRKMA